MQFRSQALPASLELLYIVASPVFWVFRRAIRRNNLMFACGHLCFQMDRRSPKPSAGTPSEGLLSGCCSALAFSICSACSTALSLLGAVVRTVAGLKNRAPLSDLDFAARYSCRALLQTVAFCTVYWLSVSMFRISRARACTWLHYCPGPG